MADNFFALLEDGSTRRITLVQNIEDSIRNVFIEYGTALYEEKEEIEFDGNYKIEDDEVLYVVMDLPPGVADVINNPIGIPILDLEQDKIKALFWFEDGQFYFQTFDNRKMLQHKNVIFYDNQTFNRLTQKAFVIDNTVNAVYRNERYYFLSYPVANRIFSLMEFYKEATNEELIEFAAHASIAISDPQWFVDNSNTVIRKQVALLHKSGVLNGANTAAIKVGAERFRVPLELDEDGRIIFPQDRRACKDILYFLNEQLYEGPITNLQYKTSSKKLINVH